MKGTWQTTDSGGSGLGLAVLIIVAAALVGPAVGAAAVAAAVAELVHIVLIAVAVLFGVAAAGLVAFIAYRLRHPRTNTSPPWAVDPPRQPQAVQGRAERRAIERPAVHLHFHGVDAEDVAEILRHELP